MEVGREELDALERGGDAGAIDQALLALVADVVEEDLRRLEVRCLRATGEALHGDDGPRAVVRSEPDNWLKERSDSSWLQDGVQRRLFGHQCCWSNVEATVAISRIAFGLCRNASAPRLYDSRSISGVPNALRRMTRVFAQR